MQKLFWHLKRVVPTEKAYLLCKAKKKKKKKRAGGRAGTVGRELAMQQKNTLVASGVFRFRGLRVYSGKY